MNIQLRFRVRRIGAMTVLAAFAAMAGCSGSGGTANTVAPPAPTATPTPTPAPTTSLKPTATPTPSATPTPTPIPTPTPTPSPKPTATPTPSPTPTPTPTPTPKPTSTPTPTPTPVPAHLFVADQNSNAITGYPTGAHGNQAPVATITRTNTALGAPVAIDVDAAGNIYVANLFSVTVYPPNPTGTLNEAPTATINVNNGGVTLYGMGVDASGKIYVAYPGTIEVYAAHPVGPVTTPIATIAGSNTHLAEVHSIAFNVAGRIYATDNVYGIDVFAPNPVGNLNEAPLATIAGSNTGLDGGTDGMTLGPTGIIYAVNRNVSTITKYAANPFGTLNETPIVTISGSNTGLSSPTEAAVH